MPQSGCKRLLRIKFRRSKNSEKNTEKDSTTSLETINVGNPEGGFPTFDEPNRSKQSCGSRRNAHGGKLEKVKMAGGMPPRSKLNVFSGKSVKSRNIAVDKLPTRNAALLDKQMSSPGTISESFMQKEHVSGRFLSVLIGRGKLIKNKVAAQLLGRRVWGDTDNAKRLPHAKRIQLFQALLNEPVTFLDLHVRFGVSKQTIRRLVKNRLLLEDWGPKSIGVRFRLSKKGKTYLRELEAAALYKSNVGQKNLIRLKSKS
jgi:hypothetical protein